ncbi:MAG: pilus assembly protein PilM [bacterium]|nr:pilus assembly protein PilM [bacterium]
MFNQKKQFRRLVGVDISRHELTLVEVRYEHDQPVIEKHLIVPIPPTLNRTEPESFGKWLAALWKKEQIKTRMVRFTLPRADVLTTEFTLPLGSELETTKMLELQLERELPASLDSVASDYFILQKTEPGEQKIMVITAKQTDIAFYRNVCKVAGLKLNRIELSSLSLNRAIQYEQPRPDLWLVVNIGSTETEIMVIENKRVIYTRSASFGFKALLESMPDLGQRFQTESDERKTVHPLTLIDYTNPEAINWVNQLIFELRRNLESYALAWGKPSPKQVLFCGAGNYLPQVAQAVTEQLHCTVHCLTISRGTNGLLEKQQSAITAFGSILPEGVTDQYCDLNQPRLFAVEPFHVPVYIRQVAIGFGLAAIIIVILLGLLLHKQKQLVRLQSEYAVYRPLIIQSEQSNINLSTIKTWKQEAASVLEILHSISVNWSDDAYLQVMTYDRTKDITLSGLASSTQAVSNLLKRLNESNRFASIRLLYCRISKRNPTYPIEFGLSLKYIKTEERKK